MKKLDRFVIKKRMRRGADEWQVWRGRIVGRCPTEEAARRLMRYLVGEERRTRDILVARRDAALAKKSACANKLIVP